MTFRGQKPKLQTALSCPVRVLGAEPGSSARTSCILKHHGSSPYLMLLLNKEFIDLARLAAQRAPEMLLIPPQCWDYMHIYLYINIYAYTGFYVEE